MFLCLFLDISLSVRLLVIFFVCSTACYFLCLFDGLIFLCLLDCLILSFSVQRLDLFFVCSTAWSFLCLFDVLIVSLSVRRLDILIFLSPLPPTPRINTEWGGGVYWNHFVPLSVCPSVFQSMCPSLSGQYLLNRSTIFNRTWYGGVSSQGGVSCRKIGSRFSISLSQRGLI